MADPRFYDKAGPFSVATLAQIVGGRYDGPPDTLLADIAALDEAQADEIAFLSDRKLADKLDGCQAGAVLVSEGLLAEKAERVIICADAYLAMAQVAQQFYPQATRCLPMPGDLQEGHAIHPTAKLEENVQVGAGAVIGPRAEIGRDTVIAAGAIIGHGVVIGRGCSIGAHSVIGYALLGDNVIVASLVTIGSDGYGFVPGKTHTKIPQLGRVIVQANVEIGTACTIDRGSLSDTVIGEGSKLDNQVHVAHNVIIGRHCLITAQCCLAGSTVLGDYVQMGGRSGVVNHLSVGDHSRIGAGAGVLRSLPPYSDVSGIPARPRSEVYRDAAFVSRLRRQHESKKKVSS